MKVLVLENTVHTCTSLYVCVWHALKANNAFNHVELEQLAIYFRLDGVAVHQLASSLGHDAAHSHGQVDQGRQRLKDPFRERGDGVRRHRAGFGREWFFHAHFIQNAPRVSVA